MLRLMRPPSSTPNTTSLQRLARWSSGYVRCFRSRAWARARPGSLSAPGRALPSRRTGLTIVASNATWAPCQRGRPFATTSMRHPSAAGTSRFKSRRATFVATRAPASLQMRAAAHSSRPARLASAPTWAQAERWSPRSSRRPPQGQCSGASGSGSRSLRSSRTPSSASGTAVSGLEGVAVKAQPAASPPCDSSSARDAGSRSAKSVSSARVQGSSRRVSGRGRPPTATVVQRPLHPSPAAMPRKARRIPGNAGAALLAQPLTRLGAYWRQTRPTGGERRAPAACPPRTPSMRRCNSKG